MLAIYRASLHHIVLHSMSEFHLTPNHAALPTPNPPTPPTTVIAWGVIISITAFVNPGGTRLSSTATLAPSTPPADHGTDGEVWVLRCSNRQWQ